MKEILIGIAVVAIGVLLRYVLYERYRNRPNKTFYDDLKRRKK